MEITDIKDSVLSLPLQEPISNANKKAGPAKERSSRDDEGMSELVRRISSGDKDALKGLAESFNKLASGLRFDLRFVVDRQSGGVVVEVLDGDGNLIRRIPPENVASFSSGAGMDIGLLLNKQL